MQFRFPFLPAGIFLKMAHLIENCRFYFFRFQPCLEDFVLCLYFSLRGDFKWFLYLVLCTSLCTEFKIIKVRKLSSNRNVFSYFSCLSVNETNKI